MDKEDTNHLLKIVNASGFLFQLRVEDEIKTRQQNRESGWEVVSREHRWLDPLTSNEGFIDLVLQSKGIARMVVECKRVRDGKWIFLIPDDKVNMGRARLLWTYFTEEKKILSDWDDFKITPYSHESSFCIVRGQGEKDTPMLERLSGILLRSTESLAGMQIDLEQVRKFGPALVYFPAIVTNAELRVCKFDPKKIDLATGMLKDRDADFKPVPYIRFRKSLSTVKAPLVQHKSLAESAQIQERTVLIINSSHLGAFLKETEINLSGIGKWPWELAIERGYGT